MLEPKWIFEDGKFVAIEWVAIEATNKKEVESNKLDTNDELIKQAS